MELRRGRGRRSATLPQPNLSVHKKPCIYKLGNNVCNQDLLPQDRLALYDFEVDENEPLPNKKRKKKRKVRSRKKMGLSAMRGNYTRAATADERLPSTSKRSVAKRKKPSGSVTVKNVADTGQHNVGEERRRSVPVAHAHSGGVAGVVDEPTDMMTSVGLAEGSESEPSLLFSPIEKRPVPVAHAHSGGLAGMSVGLAEGSESEPSLLFSPIEKRPVPVAHAHSGGLAGTSVGLAEGSECRSSLLFSPIEKCRLRASAFPTVRWPARATDTHGIQSAEDFTVHNYFGFEEESDDDLRSSLSPVKMAPHSSGPSAVSSTPNLKPTFTRPQVTSVEVMQTRTALVPVQSTAVPKRPLASSVDPPDRAGAGYDPSPPVLFADGSESTTHFMKVSVTPLRLAPEN
jgi:hypothetical protein